MWLNPEFILSNVRYLLIIQVRHKSVNTPLSHERLVGGLQDGDRCTHVTHFVQLYPQPLYTASQVRTTCRSWDEGVLTDVCLTLYNMSVSTRNRTHEPAGRKVKVKQSRNRPGVAQTVPGGLGSQIFMTFGT